MTKKHLVISAVNLTEGGPLEILRQCLHEAALITGWRVTAIVNNPKLIGIDGITYIARPDIKPSWTKRIYFEYIECRSLAKKIHPDFWLSLHDITPNLGTLSGKIPQAVYCHNAIPFYKMSWHEIKLDPKLFIFSKLYSFFYKINLKKNNAVIVQQSWMKEIFINRLGYKKEVIVAQPQQTNTNKTAKKLRGKTFFFPSLPRVFKNYELVLDAWEILTKNKDWDGKLILTINEHSNRYGLFIKNKYNHLRNVSFIGLASRTEMESLYKQCDCLVFPSKLETWGLPLTEAKEAGLTILAADLPYAHETVGDYSSVVFFNKDNANNLANIMFKFYNGTLCGTQSKSKKIHGIHAKSWENLFSILLQK